MMVDRPTIWAECESCKCAVDIDISGDPSPTCECCGGEMGQPTVNWWSLLASLGFNDPPSVSFEQVRDRIRPPVDEEGIGVTSILPLEDDPNIPHGSMFEYEVLATSYIVPNGDPRFRVSFRGRGRMLSYIGILEAAKMKAFELYQEHEDDDDD